MKIVIMGAGGVGAFFGAKLLLAGNDVTFVARGPHLQAMLKDGLTISSTDGDMRLKTVQATDDPASIDTAEVIIFTTKLYDTINAAEQIKSLVGPQTIIITLQNGVSSPDMIAGVVGQDCVLGGSTYIVSHIEAPGKIEHMGPARLVFGEMNGSVTSRALAFERVCKEANIDVKLTDQIELEMWRKYVPLTVISGLTASIRGPIGTIFDDPDLATLARQATCEVIAVGRAKGIAFPDNAEDQSYKNMFMAPRDTMSSMSIDLMRGKKMELPWLSAKVAEFGKEAGVATPTHHFMASILRPFQDGEQG